MPDDDSIRAVLADLPKLSYAHKPYGHVAIPVAAIEETDDPAAAVAWIEARGGELIERIPVRPRGFAPGLTAVRHKTVDPYYILKEAELKAPA